MTIEIVTSGANLDHVRSLLKEYADWLNVDLSFQDFDRELRELPGDYVAPDGTLLLCTHETHPVGCVAVRRWDSQTAEMKRLYVRPQYHGRGYGLILAQHAVDWARDAGYARMLLDTMPQMTQAQRLYERLGFRDVQPYRFNPVQGTRFMAILLRADPQAHRTWKSGWDTNSRLIRLRCRRIWRRW